MRIIFMIVLGLFLMGSHCSDGHSSGGQRTDGPVGAVPEASAALLFAAGAYLVWRRTRK